MKKIAILLFIMLTIESQAQTSDYGVDSSYVVPNGLSEGTIAPDFFGEDQNGEMVRLSEQRKNGPVVLIFYRGYWCPVCSRYLSKFQDDLSIIIEKGASVIAISPEQNDGVNKTIKKNTISFSILSDEKYSIMDQYGVRFLVTDQYASKIKTRFWSDIAQNNGDDKPYLPVPATYVIGQDGKIIKTFFDLNYKNRPTVEEIANYLD